MVTTPVIDSDLNSKQYSTLIKVVRSNDQLSLLEIYIVHQKLFSEVCAFT
jgi:hypothetical protein